MTPAEEALRDAFLAECWPVVREWHDDPQRRPEPVRRTVEKPRKKAA